MDKWKLEDQLRALVAEWKQKADKQQQLYHDANNRGSDTWREHSTRHGIYLAHVKQLEELLTLVNSSEEEC
jgi:hypothetical protein